MMTKFCVTYFSDDKYTHKHCDSKRDASNFARKTSKNSAGKASYIYRCTGIMNEGTFYETESTYVAAYRDGKRQ